MKYLASFTTLCLLATSLFGSTLVHSAVPTIDRTHHPRYQNAIALDNILEAEGERLKTSLDFKVAGKFFGQKNYPQAIYYYSRALTTHPNTSVLYLMRGFSYGQMGQYESAMVDTNMALAIHPLLSMAIYNRGYYHYMTGNKAGCSADAVKAISLFKKEGDTKMSEGAVSLLNLCYQ